MEFSWTTFGLEIVNFLVLAWILQRFLYKPVTNAIGRRKAAIDSSIAEARALEAAAQALKNQYESRVADWEQERERARTGLADEIAAERARLMAELQKSLEEEREKSRALERRHAIELGDRLAEEARATGARFAARLLSRMAGPPLEERIREVALEDLPQLPEDRIQALRQACVEADAKVRITSAYPLAPEARDAMAKALADLTGQAVSCEFGVDPELIAGLRVTVGPWVLRCSLQDELALFAEAVPRAG